MKKTSLTGPRRRGKDIDYVKLEALWTFEAIPVPIIASLLQHTPLSIRRAAKRLGLCPRPTRTPGRAVKEISLYDADLLASLWEAKVRVVDIATVMGCSQGQITRLVKRAGLPRRRGEYAPRGQSNG